MLIKCAVNVVWTYRSFMCVGILELWHMWYWVVVLSVEFWVPGKKYVVKCLVYLMRMMYWVTRLLVDLINVEDCECW